MAHSGGQVSNRHQFHVTQNCTKYCIRIKTLLWQWQNIFPGPINPGICNVLSEIKTGKAISITQSWTAMKHITCKSVVKLHRSAWFKTQISTLTKQDQQTPLLTYLSVNKKREGKIQAGAKHVVQEFSSGRGTNASFTTILS